MLIYVYAYYLCLSMLNISPNFGKNYNGGPINQAEVVRQSHTVPKIGTVCNDFHFACCVNHTRFALANRRPQNSLWDRKRSPPDSKNKKENPHHLHVKKNLTPPATPFGPHLHLHKLLRVYAMAPPIAVVNT